MAKRNALPQRQIDALKNQTYTVLTFGKDGKRLLTYSNLNAYTAMHEIMLKSQSGLQVLVIEGEIPISQGSRDIADYWQYTNKLPHFPTHK